MLWIDTNGFARRLGTALVGFSREGAIWGNVSKVGILKLVFIMNIRTEYKCSLLCDAVKVRV